MKRIALLGAVALAAGTLAAVPADAQRWGDRGGWDGPRHGPGWDRGRRWDHGPGWGRDWDRDRYRGGWGRGSWDRGGYRAGWDGGGYYGRPRTVCRIVRGYYGPERRCFYR